MLAYRTLCVRNLLRTFGFCTGLLFILTGTVSAQWVHWESGQSFSEGKAVLSSGGDPQSDGVFQLFHFHQVNFEICLNWKAGDTLQVAPEDQGVLLYTLNEAAQSVSVELLLSHRLGAGNLEEVSGEAQTTVASVLCGNVAGASVPLSFQIQLFNEGIEIGYDDLPGGIDYDSAPGLTFAHRPDIALLENANSAEYQVGENGAVSLPQTGNSYLSVASFGEGGSSWDRIVLTFQSDDAEIPAGTQFRIMIAGAPLARSAHKMPCTADRLPPILLLNSGQALVMPITGLRYADTEAGEFHFSVREPLLAMATATEVATFEKGRATLALGLKSGSIAAGQLLIDLESGGYRNLQATTAYSFDRYRLRPLEDLLNSAWAREPEEWQSERPLDRPLWESSFALCDKVSPGETGILIEYPGGNFEARHFDIRRSMFGALKNESSSGSLPGMWKQSQAAPEELSDSPGVVECANDVLNLVVGGYRNVEAGTRPCLWIQNGELGWDELLLQTRVFTSDGRVLTVSDRGIAGGYTEVYLGEQPTRLPCLWLPGASGAYEQMPVVLPVSNLAMGAAVLDLNVAGQAVGYYVDQSGHRHACRWEVDPPKFIDLETEGMATSINSVGIAVGHGVEGCFLWQGAERLSLNEISGSAKLASVFGITDFGDLLGRDRDTRRVIAEPQSMLKW
jgi:hypothetical protein